MTGFILKSPFDQAVPDVSTPKKALRQRLLEQRAVFAISPQAITAGAALADQLTKVLLTLEPELLGVYWPQHSEFNAVNAIAAHVDLRSLRMALPFAVRNPVQMHYHTWNLQPPATVDDCNIPSCAGQVVVPDVVLVPCVGFTASGFRLGYGGGYFDRWVAQHPDVTAIGVAWAIGEIDETMFKQEAHDVPLTLIVTELGT
jgi:5-formyltetrahydrofolate cyclo-ligase